MARAAAFTWVWGADPDRNTLTSEGGRTHGKHNSVVNSTGAGAAFNCFGYGEQYTFQVESNDSNWAYQIRAGRTSSGPFAVVSSNSGTSTSAPDVVQLPGPFNWLCPRVDALASTANYLIIKMEAVD